MTASTTNQPPPSDSPLRRILTATEILDKWAEALRGNWADIDGRSSRAQLKEITAYLRGDKPTLDRMVGVVLREPRRTM